MTAAVILSAGASSRMGRPKAYLEYRGETFLGRLVRIFTVYCEDVIVVCGADFPVSEVVSQSVRMVVNPQPGRGMLSSLQCGLADLPATAQAVAFTPVDVPAVAERTMEQVIAGWSGELLRIPRHGGRRGHPVLVSRELVPEFLALAPTARTDEVIRRHEGDIRYVEVDDPGILRDVDTPEDYEQLR